MIGGGYLRIRMPRGCHLARESLLSESQQAVVRQPLSLLTATPSSCWSAVFNPHSMSCVRWSQSHRSQRSAVSTAQAATVAPHSSQGRGCTTRSVALTAQDGGGSRAIATSRLLARVAGEVVLTKATQQIDQSLTPQEGMEPPEDLTYLQSLIQAEIQWELAQGETTPNASRTSASGNPSAAPNSLHGDVPSPGAS